MRVNGAQVTELRVTPELQMKWDKKLSSKQPLAPRDLQGHLTQGEYNVFSNDFEKFSAEYSITELDDMRSYYGAQGLRDYSVSVPGVGLGRGLGFVKRAVELGMKVNIYDVSIKALKLSRVRLGKLPKEFKKLAIKNTHFHHEEILGLPGEIAHDSKLIIMEQFLQILSPETMRAVMRACAENLRQCPGSRIVITHRIDTRIDDIPGDTTVYTEDELLTPLRSGMYSDPVGIIRRSKIFPYFNYHDYQAITIARL